MLAGIVMRISCSPSLCILFSAIAIASCKEPVPEFVHDLIESYPTGSMTHEIWQYRYEGKTVYYVPPQAYDIPSTLFDSDGETICSPDGGLRGDGDGRCTDFFRKRKGGKLIWKVGQEIPSRE